MRLLGNVPISVVHYALGELHFIHVPLQIALQVCPDMKWDVAAGWR